MCAHEATRYWSAISLLYDEVRDLYAERDLLPASDDEGRRQIQSVIDNALAVAHALQRRVLA